MDNSLATSADFYHSIYDQDTNTDGISHGWIQWKGTEVCIDLHCICGAHEHYDGEFFYHWACPRCSKCYAVGQNVKLIQLTKEQAISINKEWGSDRFPS